jgi:hypothetical protein
MFFTKNLKTNKENFLVKDSNKGDFNDQVGVTEE